MAGKALFPREGRDILHAAGPAEHINGLDLFERVAGSAEERGEEHRHAQSFWFFGLLFCFFSFHSIHLLLVSRETLSRADALLFHVKHFC